MKRIIIDECLPKKLRTVFPENYEAYTVPQLGLSGYSDYDLLEELAKREIDCFITIDGNMEYQHALNRQPFGTVVLRSPSNRFHDLLPLKALILDVIEDCETGKIIHIPV
ncbi:DUF5615 family PIN-like protein [Nitratifractor sp.]